MVIFALQSVLLVVLHVSALTGPHLSVKFGLAIRCGWDALSPATGPPCHRLLTQSLAQVNTFLHMTESMGHANIHMVLSAFHDNEGRR